MTKLFGINKILIDIKDLQLKQGLFLIGVFTFFTTNTIISYKNSGNILSLLSAITSIFNIILIANKKISNFIGGIVSCALYGVYAYRMGYVGDAVLNFIGYLPLAIIGYFFWKKKMNKNNNVVKRRNWKWKYAPLLIMGSAITFAMGLFLIPKIAKLNGGYNFNLYSGQHILDTTTNTLGVVSTILMQSRLGIENICYIISNPMNIAMGSIMFDLNMIITYSIYLIVSFVGLIKGYDLDTKIKEIVNETTKNKLFRTANENIGQDGI